MPSILERARQEGWNNRANYQAQIDEFRWEDAVEEGRRMALREAPSRFRWFAIGVIAATVMGYWI